MNVAQKYTYIYIWLIITRAINLINQSEYQPKAYNRRQARETCNQRQARDNMQPAPSAGKHATGAKHRKTMNRSPARKTVNRSSARKNMPPVRSAGKHTTGTRRGKDHLTQVDNYRTLLAHNQSKTEMCVQQQVQTALPYFISRQFNLCDFSKGFC